MAGLLDYVANAMAGGNPTAQEKQYADMAQSEADKKKMQQIAIAKLMQGNNVGNVTDNEALRQLEAQRKAAYGIGNVPDLEALKMESLKNSLPYSLYRPVGAYQAPQNTMQNILPELGGISASNAKPTMDLNALLRMLGR